MHVYLCISKLAKTRHLPEHKYTIFVRKFMEFIGFSATNLATFWLSWCVYLTDASAYISQRSAISACHSCHCRLNFTTTYMIACHAETSPTLVCIFNSFSLPKSPESASPATSTRRPHINETRMYCSCMLDLSGVGGLGVGVKPPAGAFHPPKFLLTPDWFSQNTSKIHCLPPPPLILPQIEYWCIVYLAEVSTGSWPWKRHHQSDRRL